MGALLDKAKKSDVKKRMLPITGDDVELAMAWAMGEIGTGQVADALGTKGSNVYVFLARALATHYRNSR